MAIPTTQPVRAQENIDSNKSYLVPFILVTSLFFLWGMANIMNSALISQFQPVFTISRAQAMFVETAFYFGYFTIAIPAGIFMEKYSYKKGILIGLILYAIGAFLFIPAAKLMTFGFFLFALYIIASGLAFLETAANPYVTILGKPETSVLRLNFAQSFNGLALVFGPLIAGRFIFAGNEGAMTTLAEKQQAADAVIIPYAVIGAVVLLVAFCFYMTRMPEPAKGVALKFDKGIFKQRHLVYAVIAQLFYVGAQAGIWGITIDYVTDILPGTSKELASQKFLLIGTLLFVTGRVVGTFLLTFIKDHKLLTTYAMVAALLCLAGAFANGMIAVYSVLAINFFMSIMFPTIFALGVKNLGEFTKLGSSFIIMAIVGGAILPPVMGYMAIEMGMQISFVLPCMCFLIVAWYGVKGYNAKPAH